MKDNERMRVHKVAIFYQVDPTVGIISVQDSACPTSDNLFKYYDGGKWTLAPINSVSIHRGRGTGEAAASPNFRDLLKGIFQ